MTEAYTRVPNVYLDRYLPELSYAETKVMLAILRKTVGWQKESDEISLSQLEAMTGLARHSVIAGLKGLVRRGLVVQTKGAGGNRAASYKCAVPSASGAESTPVGDLKGGDQCTDCTATSAVASPVGGAATAPVEDEQCSYCTASSAATAPLAVQLLHSQKKEKEKEKKESARIARALSSSLASTNGKTRDYLDHVLDRLDGHDPIERTILAWSLPSHLEAQCLAFARIFEVTPTKGDKARWARGSETLHELRCDEARLKAARDEARKAGLICTWPGAVINLNAIRSIQQEYELVYDEERNVYIRQQKRN